MKPNQKNFYHSHFLHVLHWSKVRISLKIPFWFFSNYFRLSCQLLLISVCAFLSFLCAICNIQCKCNSICIHIGHVKCQFQWTATIKYANYLKYTPRKADMLNYFNTTFQYDVFQLKYFQEILSFAVLSLHTHTVLFTRLQCFWSIFHCNLHVIILYFIMNIHLSFNFVVFDD